MMESFPRFSLNGTSYFMLAIAMLTTDNDQDFLTKVEPYSSKTIMIYGGNDQRYQ